MVYFEVFGSMAQTGLGLIVTGILFLGMARLWQKHRRTFLEKLEGQR